ncbi:MAG TPA: glutamate--tRNA ligase [Dehalococcoidia bacterium]|nr:glutamate--tRNA ligase [Dehalococcoidia bacterium]
MAKEKENVRVRYAPSPTGSPHVGNIRTALFNWLFARHHGGSFIVRIEDTDVARRVEGAVDTILEALRWLDMNWDEGPEVGGEHGPYFQSQRLELYQSAAKRLVEQGDAYYCYCTPERLEEMRAEQVKLKQPPGYDRRCRGLSATGSLLKFISGSRRVIRFMTPLEKQTSFTDLIRGEVTFENANIDDFVLLKSDGYPTYHLASVVDDHVMAISHVLRAEEWLSSTPRHLMLYRALGYKPPQFAHLPMLLGTDRSKLSKRHGAVSVTEYKAQGYLAEAMLNFLSLLGWSLDDKTEIMNRQKLIDNFSLKRVSQTAAIFNREKLDWMNGFYIRSLDIGDFTRRVIPFLERDLSTEIKRPLPDKYVSRITPLIHERVKTLADVTELTDFFFIDELDYKPELLIVKKMNPDLAVKVLETSRKRLGRLKEFDENSLEGALRPLTEELEMKTGQVFGTLRVAVTGRSVAPPLFQTMAVLGRERCLDRIKAALRKLKVAPEEPEGE